MPRSVNHVASRARRKKILGLTRGYFGARKNVWTVAKNTWEKGLTYAYRDRKNKKRNFRANRSLNSLLKRKKYKGHAKRFFSAYVPFFIYCR